MAKTFKIVNGDFILGHLNQFETLTGIDLLRQHVFQALMEATQIEDLNQVDVGDSVLDVVESILQIRIWSAINVLQNLLSTQSVIRNNDEQIGEINAILVQRDPNEPRTFRFWAGVLSLAGVEAAIRGKTGL